MSSWATETVLNGKKQKLKRDVRVANIALRGLEGGTKYIFNTLCEILKEIIKILLKKEWNQRVSSLKAYCDLN